MLHAIAYPGICSWSFSHLVHLVGCCTVGRSVTIVDQLIHWLVSWDIDQSLLVGSLVSHLVGWSIQSIGWFDCVFGSVSLLICCSIGWSVCSLVGQLVGPLVSQLVDLLFHWLVSWFIS